MEGDEVITAKGDGSGMTEEVEMRLSAGVGARVAGRATVGNEERVRVDLRKKELRGQYDSLGSGSVVEVKDGAQGGAVFSCGFRRGSGEVSRRNRQVLSTYCELISLMLLNIEW